MTFLILHGILGSPGENWTQWLHDNLVKNGHTVIMPALSEPDKPRRQEWLGDITNCTTGISPGDLTIVAHSLGVTSALDYIETLDTPLAKLVSVSGFAIPYGLELNEYFLQEKGIDFDAVNANLTSAAVFYGDDDPYVTQEALSHLASELKANPVVIEQGGHLNADAGYTEFPELLQECLKRGSL